MLTDDGKTMEQEARDSMAMLRNVFWLSISGIAWLAIGFWIGSCA